MNGVEKYNQTLADYTFAIETGFLPNGNSMPSTSNNPINYNQEIKSQLWREASLKLSRMFPNADPELIKQIYISKSSETTLKTEDELLQAVAEEILNTNDDSNQFQISLLTANPKTKADKELEKLKFIFENAHTENYSAMRMEMEENSCFNVENFLEKVPYPVEYFENPDRKCYYNLTMFELLKNYFRKLTISTISNAYTRCDFNAVLAFEILKGTKIEIKKCRKKSSVASDDSCILQEFDYIINKQEIKNFIRQKKEKEEKMLQRMREKHEFLECECCYEEIDQSILTISCREGHVFCGSCAKKGTDEELSKGLTRIKCFAECSSDLNLNSLQKVLSPEKFKILLSKVQEQEIISAKIEGLVSCPFCHFASIPPEEEIIFKCLNLDCLLESCRLCKKLNHFPKECESIERNKKARLILEEKMTAALVRKCGQCGKEIIKEGGCNVITCSCGGTFCYFCGQSTISHAHLNGSCNSTITSSTDASAVVFVARKIEDELLKLDPNLKIDVNSILPTVSSSSGNGILPAHALNATNTIPDFL